MSKKITFTDNKVKYTLEFTRDAVKKMETDGFSISDASTKMVSTIPALFAGAFIANHPDITQEQIDKIYEAMPDKTALIEKLAIMYSDVINTLLSEPEDGSKKIEWRASW